MESVLIHVGYPKTASTYLQAHLFREEFGFQQFGTWAEIWARLIGPNPLWYSPEAVRETVEPTRRTGAARGLIPVITHELLVGHPVSGGHQAAWVAQRLADLWPEAQILMVIREQRQLLYSLYAQYARGSGPLSLEEYMFPPGGERQPSFDFRYLEFDRLIRLYQKRFPRVKVLCFEALRANPLAFCREILDLQGLPQVDSLPSGAVNAAPRAPTIAFRSYANRWLLRGETNHVAPFSIPAVGRILDRLDHWWPERLAIRLRRRLEEQIEEAVGERFAASNQRTAKLIDVDLRGLGYQVA